MNYSLPKLLRVVGALLLFGSAASFMMMEWVGFSSLLRYCSFLTFTLLLACFGVISGAKFKESKGARTFLGVATAIVPIHFAQLGALVYAQYLGEAADVSALFKFTPLGLPATIAVVVLAAFVVTSLSYVGFSALARTKAKQLTLSYASISMLLLLPIRDPLVCSLIAVLSVTAIATWDYVKIYPEVKLKNFEGYSARAMLYTPYVLFLGRTFVYTVSPAISALCLISVGVAIFCNAKILPENFAKSVQPIGSFFIVSGAITFLHSCFDSYFSNDANHMLFTVLPLAVLLKLAARYSLAGEKSYNYLGATVVTILGVSLLSSTSIIPGATLTGLGVGYLVFGSEEKCKLQLILGGICFISGLTNLISLASEFFLYSPWLTLAISGTLIVFTSSYLETKGRLVQKYVSQIKDW